jgi:hypothetical protein
MKPTSDTDLAYVVGHRGIEAPYRRALLTAFDEHPGIPLEYRISAMFDLAIIRMDESRYGFREYLAMNLYKMADALAVKGPK